MNGLLQWAVTGELNQASPCADPPPARGPAPIPFLFDVAQARQLLDVAGALPDNPRALHRGQTYRTIFALCYGLGLRAGEACGLRLGDVDPDRQLLVVRGGKFGKSRLVPHGPRIGELVAGQAGRRRADGAEPDAAAPLFTFNGRTPVNPCTASQAFHHLMPELGLTVPDGVSPPRLHSLRHSFAVACLLRWYRDGADPAGAALPAVHLHGSCQPCLDGRLPDHHRGAAGRGQPPIRGLRRPGVDEGGDDRG